MVDRQLGDQGEQEARARLERALLGTGVRLSGNADLGLDIVVQFSPPTPDPVPLHFGIQVKTGNSYARSDGNRWLIKNLSEQRFRQWRKSTLPVLFVWVRPSVPAECMWALIKKDTSFARFSISKRALITPVLRYDLTLESSRDEHSVNQIAAQPLRPPLGVGLRQFAKSYYRTSLQTDSLSHPVLGPIDFTNLGWDHLTSRQRPLYYVQHSLQLLGCLPRAVALSNRFVGLRRLSHVKRGSMITEVRLVVFQGPQAHFVTRPPANLMLVFRERISYPTRWFEDVTFHKSLQREVTFESIYEKIPRARK